MSHSYTKIWIHSIFGTKFRQPLIKETFDQELYSYIRQELNLMNCPVKIINGTEDHIHILFLLSSQKSLSDVIKNSKGLSSHWVNSNAFSHEKFAWQSGYGAFSVSESALEKTYHYIRLQKEHHKKYSFAEEMDKFMELNKLIQKS